MFVLMGKQATYFDHIKCQKNVIQGAVGGDSSPGFPLKFNDSVRFLDWPTVGAKRAGICATLIPFAGELHGSAF